MIRDIAGARAMRFLAVAWLLHWSAVFTIAPGPPLTLWRVALGAVLALGLISLMLWAASAVRRGGGMAGAVVLTLVVNIGSGLTAFFMFLGEGWNATLFGAIEVVVFLVSVAVLLVLILAAQNRISDRERRSVSDTNDHSKRSH